MAHNALVSTEWVAKNLSDTQQYRIVESNEDVLLYSTGHIQNAVKIDWFTDLQDGTVRDYIDRSKFEMLCSSFGITNDTIVIFYGDKNNWWAAYAFWVFKLFGHKNCLIMDGGRAKWKAENRPVTTEIPQFQPTKYTATDPDLSIRSFRDDVLAFIKKSDQLVDVRSTMEYEGKVTHMPEYPQEGALRAGHIPGAKSIPWATAVNGDGTFKTYEELHSIYVRQKKLDPSNETIAYCRIGERSSHTWFVLKYLLGFKDVKNYDGSWTEWGNLVGVPIEKGEEKA